MHNLETAELISEFALVPTFTGTRSADEVISEVAEFASDNMLPDVPAQLEHVFRNPITRACTVAKMLQSRRESVPLESSRNRAGTSELKFIRGMGALYAATGIRRQHRRI